MSSNSAHSQISTNRNVATLGGVLFEFDFAGESQVVDHEGKFLGVELTNADGITLVINGSGTPVPASNQDALKKEELVTITLSAIKLQTGVDGNSDPVYTVQSLADYAGSYTVTLQANDKCKLSKTSGSAKTANVSLDNITFTFTIDENGDVTYGTGAAINQVYYAIDGTDSANNAHVTAEISIKSVVKTA